MADPAAPTTIDDTMSTVLGYKLAAAGRPAAVRLPGATPWLTETSKQDKIDISWKPSAGVGELVFWRRQPSAHGAISNIEWTTVKLNGADSDTGTSGSGGDAFTPISGAWSDAITSVPAMVASGTGTVLDQQSIADAGTLFSNVAAWAESMVTSMSYDLDQVNSTDSGFKGSAMQAWSDRVHSAINKFSDLKTQASTWGDPIAKAAASADSFSRTLVNDLNNFGQSDVSNPKNFLINLLNGANLTQAVAGSTSGNNTNQNGGLGDDREGSVDGGAQYHQWVNLLLSFPGKFPGQWNVFEPLDWPHVDQAIRSYWADQVDHAFTNTVAAAAKLVTALDAASDVLHISGTPPDKPPAQPGDGSGSGSGDGSGDGTDFGPLGDGLGDLGDKLGDLGNDLNTGLTNLGGNLGGLGGNLNNGLDNLGGNLGGLGDNLNNGLGNLGGNLGGLGDDLSKNLGGGLDGGAGGGLGGLGGGTGDGLNQFSTDSDPGGTGGGLGGLGGGLGGLGGGLGGLDGGTGGTDGGLGSSLDPAQLDRSLDSSPGGTGGDLDGLGGGLGGLSAGLGGLPGSSRLASDGLGGSSAGGLGSSGLGGSSLGSSGATLGGLTPRQLTALQKSGALDSVPLTDEERQALADAGMPASGSVGTLGKLTPAQLSKLQNEGLLDHTGVTAAERKALVAAGMPVTSSEDGLTSGDGLLGNLSPVSKFPTTIGRTADPGGVNSQLGASGLGGIGLPDLGNSGSVKLPSLGMGTGSAGIESGGLDTQKLLASGGSSGFGGGAGGAGSLGGLGGASRGVGGVSGGVGSLGGTSGGASAGLGGTGLSGTGLSGTGLSGTGLGGTGASGANGVGGTGSTTSSGSPMMPMGGMGGLGGSGNGEKKDRERTTWLTEDEDAWGTDPDCAPAVVGRRGRSEQSDERSWDDIVPAGGHSGDTAQDRRTRRG